MNDSFLHKLFAFRFVSLCGIIIAFGVFSLRSETKPLSSFLTQPTLYIVPSLVAIGVRIVLWVTVDEGTFYEFHKLIMRTIEDCIIINIVVLCMLSFLFLVTSFI